MKLDTFFGEGLADVAEAAARAERLGFAAGWSGEITHDPLLTAAGAALATDKIDIGTSITLAFARNPMSVAHQAWDLAEASGGRFTLGLGAQIKAHITRRYSMHWDRPAEQIADYIKALRAIFESFQHGIKLDYRGSHYQHTLLTPMFRPQPLPEENLPGIAIAAVGPKMTEVAGQLCEGVFFHGFTTAAYLDNVSRPALDRGAEAAGRTDGGPWRSCNVLFAIGDTDEEIAREVRKVRKQIAFYGSTPSYQNVLASIGYEDLQPDLLRLSKEGRWDDMESILPDAVFDEIAVVGSLEELPKKIAAKYLDRCDRIMPYFPFPAYEDDRMAEFVRTCQASWKARET